MLEHRALWREQDLRGHFAPPFGRCQVAIIGGGFTGASLARSLATRLGRDGAVAVFEPRAALGQGLAYDCHDDALRLNVASHRMKALPEAPDAFHQWLVQTGKLESDPEGVAADGAFYARRSDFGLFMAEQMQPLLQAGLVRHLREKVAHLTRSGQGWLITGDQGSTLYAEEVVIATTHPTARPPQALAGALEGHPRFLAETGQWNTLDTCQPDDKVLIVGAGLTALDLVASLRSKGHNGEILMLSRSGRLPQTQSLGGLPPAGNFISPPPASARQLLQTVRAAVQDAADRGLPWQSVFDTLRQQGQALWQNLSDQEQQRFMRHLKRRYETHRYRMPPQIASLLAHDMREGTLKNIAGQICRVERTPQAIHLDIILKPHGMVERHSCQWVAVATGPDYARLIQSQDYLRDLADARLIRPDIHGLGLDVDENCRALRRNGLALGNLFVAGPLTRGRFGELTGAPEIAAQAERIAEQMLERLRHGVEASFDI